MSGSQETPKGKLVREYILKNPGASKRSIAKKLYEDYPIIFLDVEQARTMIRYKTASLGKKMRQQVNNPIKHETDFSPQNPFGITLNKKSNAQKKSRKKKNSY